MLESIISDLGHKPPILNILHVIPSVSHVRGGPSRAIAVMEAAVTGAGAKVTTATTDDDGPGRRLAIHAKRSLTNGVTRFYARKWFDLYTIAPGLVLWLWRNVQRFDVVHIHALFSFTSVAAAIVARARGVPYVTRSLGTLTAYGLSQRRPWLKRLSLAIIEGPILRASAAVHFTSKAEWDEAAALGIPMRGVVIPLGVEEQAAGNCDMLLRDFPALEGRLRLLFLSRLDPKKNLEGLLHAFAQVQGRSQAGLVIAGDGPAPYVMSLKELARSLGIAQQVVWLGHVEGPRKSAAFAAADVFVVPSFSENFGIAAVEALLAGLPCILGEGIAIAKEVEAASAGVVTAPEPEAIARALEQLLCNDNLRREMGAKGKAFAEFHYSTRAMAEQLLTLYEDVRCRRGQCVHELSR
jgi:glycosyltransferase involved in cell wall biosynthesis